MLAAPRPTRCWKRPSRPAPTTSNSSEEGHTVYCDPDELHQVAKALEARFGEPRTVHIVWRPKTEVPIDEEAGQKLLRMIDALEELDDVQQVYANFDVAEDVLQRLTAA